MHCFLPTFEVPTQNFNWHPYLTQMEEILKKNKYILFCHGQRSVTAALSNPASERSELFPGYTRMTGRKKKKKTTDTVV